MLPDSICVEICQLYAQDQILRTREVYKRYPNEMNKILPMLDSINFKKALRIIKEFGFPNSTNTPQHFRGKECVKMGLIAIMLHNPKRVFDNKEVFLEAFTPEKRAVACFLLCLINTMLLVKGAPIMVLLLWFGQSKRGFLLLIRRSLQPFGRSLV